jgi:MoxR-like ATPase
MNKKKRDKDTSRFKESGKIETAKNNIKKTIEEIEIELSKIIIGQKDIIRGIIRAILCNGHVLVEGVPGVAKTLIVKAFSEVMGCDMKRVQFTVDLLPTDITGIMSYTPKKGFEVIKGPIFTNFLIADEINRSPPKTQSALLEAMQEKAVSISRETYELPKPFFVMATQNPIETSGVYSLPEAQIDRFLFKLLINYPAENEEKFILDQNVTIKNFEEYKIKKVLNPKEILSIQEQIKKVFTSEVIKEYIVKIVNETRRNDHEYSKFISCGSSPRASIALHIASKAEAIMNGRNYVIPQDVKTVAYPILRHRIMLNYEAEAEHINADKIIKYILAKVNVP